MIGEFLTNISYMSIVQSLLLYKYLIFNLLNKNIYNLSYNLMKFVPMKFMKKNEAY
jgi:hypothetical protein